jgi:hypothetical protein
LGLSAGVVESVLGAVDASIARVLAAITSSGDAPSED